MKIGLISDTHGYLDPRVPELFAGVKHILHAGDIGSQQVLHELGRIAPVTAVLGNNDFEFDLRLTEVIELAGCKILVHHIVQPMTPSEHLRRELSRHQPQLVVFGHSHRAFNKTLGTRWYLNPGYAGKPRFGAARSVAVLDCARMTVEFNNLGT